MFNRPNRDDADDDIQGIQNDINRLTDSLESVLKSWSSGTKGGVETVRSEVQALLKEARVWMHGRTRIQQVMCDTASYTDSFVRKRPRCSMSTAVTVSIFIDALLNTHKS